MIPLLWVIKSWPASCAKFNALTSMVEISSQMVLVFRLCPYLLLVSQSHVEVLIACAFLVYFWWQSTQDFSRTFTFIIYQLEGSDRLTVSSSLYSICFTLSVFDNIDVLSFQNPGPRGFECKKEKMSPKSGQFFILDLFLPLLFCLLRFDLLRKNLVNIVRLDVSASM